MIIRLKVFEQTLSIAETKSVPRKGSKEYLALQFLFSSDWKDLDKICYLQKGDVSQPIDVVDNFVEVPKWFTEQDSFDVTDRQSNTQPSGLPFIPLNPNCSVGVG